MPRSGRCYALARNPDKAKVGLEWAISPNVPIGHATVPSSLRITPVRSFPQG